MNIVKENIDSLNAVIKINVIKEDYEEKVDNVLKDYRRKANIPGFRPGKVPFGMIKKMYYKPVLVDELNKIVVDSVFKYIYDEKLEILGEPLPVEKEEKSMDLDNDTEFDFSFDVGLSPSFELNISKKDKIPYYKIKVEKNTIDESVENILQRYGSFKPVDSVHEKTYLKGSIIQLDENNIHLEGGILNEESSISVAIIKDEAIKKQFIGKQKNNKVVFDLKKAFPNETEIASILKIDKDQAKDIIGNFEYSIKEITEYTKAELNQELYNKLYGENVVTSEEEFRNRLLKEIETMYNNDSNYKFNIDVKDYYIKKYKIELPVEFLKRWLLKVNKEKHSVEEIEKEFPAFEKDMKWQLINNKIIKENNIEITDNELLNQAKHVAMMQYRQYGIQNVPDDVLTDHANKVLQNEQEKRRINDMVSEQKVFIYIKENIKLDEKQITLEKFKKFFEENKK